MNADMLNTAADARYLVLPAVPATASMGLKLATAGYLAVFLAPGDPTLPDGSDGWSPWAMAISNHEPASLTDVAVKLLFATDQVPSAERERNAIQSRRDAHSRLKGERYCAWMEATAAYHDAKASNTRAIAGRVAGMSDCREREAHHRAASRAMMTAYTALMLLPLVGADDAKERRVVIRKGRGAVVDCIGHDAFAEAERRWLAHIEADAARLGRKA